MFNSKRKALNDCLRSDMVSCSSSTVFDILLRLAPCLYNVWLSSASERLADRDVLLGNSFGLMVCSTGARSQDKEPSTNSGFDSRIDMISRKDILDSFQNTFALLGLAQAYRPSLEPSTDSVSRCTSPPSFW